MNNKYKSRVDLSIEYIEANLTSKIRLSDVARASHFSPFHFHRIFTGLIGETVNDFIARRRIERAVNTLIFKTELSITQVALEGGFSSSANFSKAVKLHFGFTPSDIRNPDNVKNSKIGKITSKYGKEFKPTDLYPTRITVDVMNNSNLEDTKMNIVVKEFAEKQVCVIESKRGYEPESIFQAWDKVIDWATNNGVKPSDQQRFALAYDNPTITPIEKCRYLASIEVSDDVTIKPPFVSSTIPAGKYAVLYFKGRPKETLKAQMSIYSDWLPSSGFEPDDFPMLEHYLNDSRIDGYVEMEIQVKLKDL